MKKLILLSVFILGMFAATSAQHYKKDGTPDMRYRENKVNYNYSTPSYDYSTPSYNDGNHLKKDGTPDMRYKENKETYSTPSYNNPSYFSPYSSGSHLKNDGTPDMRYRENNPRYNYPVQRDTNGKIIRSEAAKNEFKRQTDAKYYSGYSDGLKGYVIDHIIPLKDGGCDCPENMQWQTIEEAKEKDKWE